MTVEITEEEARALSAWAAEGKRPGGTTAWGPRFTAAMAVAERVHALYPDRAGPITDVKVRAWLDDQTHRSGTDACRIVALAVELLKARETLRRLGMGHYAPAGGFPTRLLAMLDSRTPQGDAGADPRGEDALAARVRFVFDKWSAGG